jgi:hypothetical protein
MTRCWLNPSSSQKKEIPSLNTPCSGPTRRRIHQAIAPEIRAPQSNSTSNKEQYYSWLLLVAIKSYSSTLRYIIGRYHGPWRWEIEAGITAEGRGVRTGGWRRSSSSSLPSHSWIGVLPAVRTPIVIDAALAAENTAATAFIHALPGLHLLTLYTSPHNIAACNEQYWE